MNEKSYKIIKLTKIIRPTGFAHGPEFLSTGRAAARPGPARNSTGRAKPVHCPPLDPTRKNDPTRIRIFEVGWTPQKDHICVKKAQIFVKKAHSKYIFVYNKHKTRILGYLLHFNYHFFRSTC